MSRISKRLVLFIVLISAFVMLPFFVLNKQSNKVCEVSESDEISEIVVSANDDLDLLNDNVIVYNNKTIGELSQINKFSQNKQAENDNISQNAVGGDNAQAETNQEDSSYKTIHTVRVVFYNTNISGAEAFTESEILQNIKYLSAIDENDDIYSVAEYFRDISFNRISFEFSYGTKFYDNNSIESYNNRYYKNSDYNITINWYPVIAKTKGDTFWPSCLSTSRIVLLDRDSNVNVICHELIHTFGISDLYVNHRDNGFAESYVGGWDIMSFNYYATQQFPLVNTMKYVTYLSSSNYFDLQKSNIEVLDRTANVTVKASSYATEEDTMAIKITAKDLGYTGDYYKDVYFMIEYRKSNGLKDKYNPYNGNCLIVYRVNDNFRNNVNVKNSAQTFVYVFKKYNSGADQDAGLVEGDTFGFKSNQSYNTIFMPNGDNTGIVISNIKFGDNNECSFKVEIPSSEDNISVSGKIASTNGNVAYAEIVVAGEVVGTTDSNGYFYINTVKDANLTFIKDGAVIKNLVADKSYKGIILYTNDNACNIVIKNEVGIVYVTINDQTYQCDSTIFDLILNYGDKVVISCSGYKDYEFTYTLQKKIEIKLSESDKPNMIERAINNIETNWGKLEDSFENLKALFSNIPSLFN